VTFAMVATEFAEASQVVKIISGEIESPIALAAQPVPNFPRLRALALFGRLAAERAYSLVIAVQKTAQKWSVAADGSRIPRVGSRSICAD